VDEDVRSAVSNSHLRDLPPEVLHDLMQEAVRARIPAGSVTHWEGEDAPHLELVISGIVRAFVSAPDGRTMTIRYCRPGALLGALSLFTTDFVMPATVQALVDAELLRLSPMVASRAAERDTRVARAFLGELSERALTFIYEIPGSVFATVRQRVARHLLDLALERGRVTSWGRNSWRRSARKSWPRPRVRSGRWWFECCVSFVRQVRFGQHAMAS
jgi:CRP/FNR family cyclic AMP-dependent transcriptional regulator